MGPSVLMAPHLNMNSFVALKTAIGEKSVNASSGYFTQIAGEIC